MRAYTQYVLKTTRLFFIVVAIVVLVIAVIVFIIVVAYLTLSHLTLRASPTSIVNTFIFPEFNVLQNFHQYHCVSFRSCACLNMYWYCSDNFSIISVISAPHSLNFSFFCRRLSMYVILFERFSITLSISRICRVRQRITIAYIIKI